VLCGSVLSDGACGDGLLAGAESLILCGFAGLFGGNVVVFLK